MWARDITLLVQYIPGVSNTTADTESQTIRDRKDWILCTCIFQAISKAFMPLEVDLFASRLTYQTPRFFNWRPNPLAEAVNTSLKGFANPPWYLISWVLSQVHRQQAQLVLIASVWKGQTWYPLLMEILWDFPRLIAPALYLSWALRWS